MIDTLAQRLNWECERVVVGHDRCIRRAEIVIVQPGRIRKVLATRHGKVDRRRSRDVRIVLKSTTPEEVARL